MKKRTRRKSFGAFAVLLAGCSLVNVPTKSNIIEVDTKSSTAPIVQATATTATPTGELTSSPSMTATPAPVATPAPLSISDASKVKRRVTLSFPHLSWLFNGTARTPKSAYREIVCGLGVKHVRVIFVRGWLKDSSPTVFKSEYNLDWQFQILQECGVESVTVVIGRKQPHWPECHEPAYTSGMTQQEYKDHIFTFNRESVAYIADKPIVTKIQMGNEEFDDFGNCRRLDDAEQFFAEQVERVREADPLHRPIVGTVSGRDSEGIWGNWEKAAKYVDEVGPTFYDISFWNGSYHEYNNGTPADWAAKTKAQKKRVYLAELQWERWGSKDLKSLSREESFKSMDPERAKRHLKFVLDAGFDEVDFWGAEDWLYQKDQGYPDDRRGDPGMWDLAREVFKQ